MHLSGLLQTSSGRIVNRLEYRTLLRNLHHATSIEPTLSWYQAIAIAHPYIYPWIGTLYQTHFTHADPPHHPDYLFDLTLIPYM